MRNPSEYEVSLSDEREYEEQIVAEERHEHVANHQVQRDKYATTCGSRALTATERM